MKLEVSPHELRVMLIALAVTRRTDFVNNPVFRNELERACRENGWTGEIGTLTAADIDATARKLIAQADFGTHDPPYW